MEEHGGNIWSRLKLSGIAGPDRTAEGGRKTINKGQAGSRSSKLLDFSANINPLGLPQSVVKAIRNNISKLVHYPEPYADHLKKQIASYTGLEQEQILAGNGTTQLMYLICRVLRPESVVIPAPSFSEYEKAVISASGPVKRSGKTKIHYYKLRTCRGFRIETDKLLKYIDKRMEIVNGSNRVSAKKLSMVFLGNPNNPTGDFISLKEMIILVKELYKRRIWLVVDEAFIDFVPDDHNQSLISYTQKYNNLIVLRTLTKFFALPGLRVGYAVGSKKNISGLAAHIEPWSLNHLALVAGTEVLRDKNYIKRSKEYAFKENHYLYSQLKKVSFLEPFPSTVNFILCRIRPDNSLVKDSYQLADDLEKKGIIIRNCANFRNLNNSYVRVAVRTRAENKILIQALKELCSYNT